MSYPAAGPPNGQPTQQPAMNSYAAQPPAKRQRLSPEAHSPAPINQNGGYRPQAPPGAYGNPYAQPIGQQQPFSPHYSAQQTYPPNTFNSPEPYAGARQPWQNHHVHQPVRPQNASSQTSSQMMPPPPKPNKDEKEKVGVDDMNDALFSSGINLKDEENYIHNLYNNRHDSFAAQQGGSFTSNTQGSFNMLTQSTSFGSQPNGAGAGTLGAAMSQEEIEDELKHKRTRAARDRAERDQHVLKNPFLQGALLRMRLDKSARSAGIRLNMTGAMAPVRPSTVMLNDSGTEGIVAAREDYLLTDYVTPLGDILSLLSLAAGERVRGLVDESYGLARARRYADHGRVSPDFKDIAIGTGASKTEIVPDNITGTSWDQTENDKPQTTISFQSAINHQLRALAMQDQQAEKARAKKREARRKAAESAAANEDEGLDAIRDVASSDLAGTSQPLKISKKELARQQKEKLTVTEAQASASTNQTAAMMAMGGRRKNYSWMTGGATSMPTNRYAKPTPAPSAPTSDSGTPSRKDGARTPVGLVKKPEAADGMTWGEWRENSAGGRGIQIRDWLLVLERDGRQKRAWERSQLRLNGAADPTPNSVVRAA